MGSKILVIGNGFDLDIGLKSSYSDFWKCELWTNEKKKCLEKYFITSIERYRITHNWFDLETAIREGAAAMNNRLRADFNNENYQQSFLLLKSSLKQYISNEQDVFRPKSDSVAEKVLKSVEENGAFKRIYTFNYTDLTVISNRLGVMDIPYTEHVHGSLKHNDDIILGIETEEFKTIPKQLTFLVKSNSPYYKYNNLLSDLIEADEVVFFGHSINGMDFPYFKGFFSKLMLLEDKELEKRCITIITYDSSSSLQIKDNLRNNGIDVLELYNHVKLDFIQTKDIYEGNEYQNAKLYNLIDHLETAKFISR